LLFFLQVGSFSYIINLTETKKVRILASFLVFFFTVPSAVVHAQDENKKNPDVIVSPGMEIIRQGDVNVLVPKGGALYKKGNSVFMESADAYAARGFAETDSRFRKIENDLKEQKNEIKNLKKTLSHVAQELNRASEDGDSAAKPETG
jgi:hypothetical protein